MHTDQREEVTAVTFMFGIAKDTRAGFNVLKEKRAGWSGVEDGRECAQRGSASSASQRGSGDFRTQVAGPCLSPGPAAPLGAPWE